MLQKIVRPKDAAAFLGISKTTLYEHIKQGLLKPPLRLSSKTTGFLEADLLARQAEMISARDALSAGRE